MAQRRRRTERTGQRTLDALLAEHPGLRERTRAGLRALLTGGRWEAPVFGLSLVRVGGRVEVEPAPIVRGGQSRATWGLVNLVLTHADALRLCARCGDPFLSLGKRAFCTPVCTRLAMDERKAARRRARRR